MPLSEHEQRILDEIERRLAAEDPKFARQTGAATPRGVALRRVRRAMVGFALGLGLLLAGLTVPDMLVPFGLAAFGVMLAAMTVFARAAKELARGAARGRPSSSWFERFEERWRKRFDRGRDAP